MKYSCYFRVSDTRQKNIKLPAGGINNDGLTSWKAPPSSPSSAKGGGGCRPILRIQLFTSKIPASSGHYAPLPQGAGLGVDIPNEL